MRQLDDLPRLVGYVSDTVLDLLDRGYASSEIAVVYLTKGVPGQEQPLPAMIQTALNQRGVLSTWLSQDVRSKTAYDITTDTVTISTAHSVKGLDYAAVIVLGLDMVEPGERWDQQQLENIAYVAITRARYRLYVPYMDDSTLIRKFVKTAGE